MSTRASLVARAADSIVLSMVIVAIGACAFVGVRLHRAASGDITRFVVAGETFTDARDRPSGLHVFPGDGYDGQFAYRLAVHPADWADEVDGIRVDAPLRFQRIVYPALAFVASGGSESAVPWALVAVNVAGLVALTGIGAALARSSGRVALWGLVFPVYFGFVSTLSRDLHEIVEVTFVLAALLALRRARWGTAAVLLSAAVLTRETAVFVVAGLAVHRLVEIARRRDRPGRADLGWIVPGVVFAAWQGLILVAVGTLPGSSGSSFSYPGHDLVRSVPEWFRNLDSGTWAVHTLEGLALLFIVGLALFALRSTSVPTREQYAFVAMVVGALVVWHPDGSLWLAPTDLRMFADLYALAMVVLLGSRLWVAVPAGLVASLTGAAAVLSAKSI